MAPKPTRENWFLAAVSELDQIFTDRDYKLPKIRIGCGFPVGSRKWIGQCFGKDASKDKTSEIFVSPTISKPFDILEVITHELCHTIAGVTAQHKKPFIEIAKAVGLIKPWTATVAGEALSEKLTAITEKLGPYPHADLALAKKGTKKQSTRLIKVQCPKCDYIARVTRKWLDEAGAPICPVHQVAFQEEK